MSYYREVGQYYDKDAVDFERRYHLNPALQRIRQSFRERVKLHPQSTVLEVGFGPGFDLVHFAEQFPEQQYYGIDISEEMVRLTQEKIDTGKLINAQVAPGSVEHLNTLFPEIKFDMIYVFFGALNTVDDLSHAMSCLRNVLKPGGRMVLTFVNKYYLAGTLIELLKGKPKNAFARWRRVWGGYSPTNYLASKCYAPGSICEKVALPLTYSRGYSIVYPAWYYHKLHKILHNALLQMLWSIDDAVSSTKLGTFGEYMLYEFQSSET